MSKISVLLTIAGLATAISAQAAIPSSLYGSTVPDSSASRIIQVTPRTSALNVLWGQSVEFIDHGKSFAYDFDGPRADARVNLENVAPTGVIHHPVYAYVGGFQENQ